MRLGHSEATANDVECGRLGLLCENMCMLSCEFVHFSPAQLLPVTCRDEASDFEDLFTNDAVLQAWPVTLDHP